MTKPPPPLELPDHIRALLSKYPDGVRRVADFLAASPRPCVYMTSRRVGDRPTRRGGLGRLLGLGIAEPQLAPDRSKFGGRPYTTASDLPWRGFRFLGQINFGELPEVPNGLPDGGVLRIDEDRSGSPGAGAFRVRWFPKGANDHPADPGPVDSVGKYETEMIFRTGWSLPGGKAWEQILPEGDEELWQAWNDWNPDGYLDDERQECHRLFGHRSAGLDEHYGFEPASGRSDDISEYEMLLRLTFDNDAGFAWGTNWVYVILHRDDLAGGRLDRAVVTGANY